MPELMTLDLAWAACPLRIRPDLRVPNWERPTPRFSRSNLLTPGPIHVDLVLVERDIELHDILSELRLWWESTVVIILEGGMRNHWERRDARRNLLTFGWQQLDANSLTVFPPLASMPRYTAPSQRPGWTDPHRTDVAEGTLFLLASPGTDSHREPLSVNLECCFEHLHLRSRPQRIQDVPELHAHAAVHVENKDTVLGIYQHDEPRRIYYPGGMVSLAILPPGEEDESNSTPGLPDLTLYPPSHPAVLPGNHEWSCDVMFK